MPSNLRATSRKGAGAVGEATAISLPVACVVLLNNRSGRHGWSTSPLAGECEILLVQEGPGSDSSDCANRYLTTGVGEIRVRNLSLVRLGHICLRVSIQIVISGLRTRLLHTSGATTRRYEVSVGPQPPTTHLLKSNICTEKI